MCQTCFRSLEFTVSDSGGWFYEYNHQKNAQVLNEIDPWFPMVPNFFSPVVGHPGSLFPQCCIRVLTIKI